MGYDIPGHPMQNSEVPKDDLSSPLGEFSVGTDYMNTGKMGDQWGTGMPIPVTPGLLERGQKVFTRFATERRVKGTGLLPNTVCWVSPTTIRTNIARWPMDRSLIRSPTVITR
jgi:hypothetical protein